VTDPSSYRPRRGRSRSTGRLPVPRRRRPGHLRRQGQDAALAAVLLLPGPRALHPRTAAMVTTAPASSGPSWHRGRGAAAGVLLDQGVRPAVQRQVPRRQVLPVARGDAGEEFPRAGDARAKRKGTATSGPTPTPGRSARPSTCCCGSSRRAPAARGVQAAGQIGRPCLLGYIDKCSAPCVGRVSAEEHRTIARTSATSWRATTGVRQRARDGDERRRRARTSSGPPGCATTSAR
jgi:excinuclease ABC subunit C